MSLVGTYNRIVFFIQIQTNRDVNVKKLYNTYVKGLRIDKGGTCRIDFKPKIILLDGKNALLALNNNEIMLKKNSPNCAHAIVRYYAFFVMVCIEKDHYPLDWFSIWG